MARYNTALASNSIAGSTTISSPYYGAFTRLTGAAPYTVTLPDPVLYPGSNQTFYNSTTGTVTITTPNGSFVGTGGSNTPSLQIYSGNVVSVTSDGSNYIVISEDGSPLIATTGVFSSDVTINGASAIVSITPGGTLTLNPATTSSINNMSIGASTRSSGAFTTLAANNQVTFSGNISSTGTGSGTIVVTGGIGVSGNINSGGTIAAVSLNGPLTGTIQTAAQPNITSLGTLTSLSSSGNISGNNGRLVLRDDSLENWATDADNAGVAINYYGFSSGTTRNRDFTVYNGKASLILKAVGSTSTVGIGMSPSGSYKLEVSGSTYSTSFIGGVPNASGNGDNNAPFRLSVDYSSWASHWAGTPGSNDGWGLYWAGNSGARYGTNGTSGPGNIWSNASNPNEAVFVGAGGTRWTCFLENGKTWQAGDLFCAGNVYSSYSDIHLKNVIKPLENTLEKIAQIETFYYEPNELAKSLGISGGVQIGVSAQSVKAVYPELVGPSAVAEGYDTVQYDRLVTVLLDAVNQLTKRVQELESKVKE